jgi:hypothetical protein
MKKTEFKTIAATLIASAILSACNGNGSGGSTPPVTPPVPAGPDGGNQGSDAVACLAGETKRDDGSCVAECRTAADGQEYCLRLSEMPSDLDPKKKVASCEYGILDNDQCKKISVVIDKKDFSINADSSKRLNYDGKDLTLDRLALGAYEGFGYRLHYSYPTEFPSSFLESNSFANTSIEFRTKGDSVLGAVHARTYSDNHLSKTAVNFYGISFETGPIKKEEFTALCGKIQGLSDIEAALGDEFHLVEVIPLERYACGKSELIVPPSIIMECTGNDCSINEVNISWSPILENG